MVSTKRSKSSYQPSLNEVIISLGGGEAQVPLIVKASEKGYKVLVVDRDPDAPGMKLADLALNTSTYDTEHVLCQLDRLNASFLYKGLVARTSGPAIHTAAAITERYRLNGFTRKIALLATEKALLREFCIKKGIPAPQGARVADQDASSIFDLPFPVIIKPDYPVKGKKDVFISSKADRALELVQIACKSSFNQHVEAEEYIDGIDVSCMFFTDKGDAKIIAFWDELVAVMKDGTVSGLGVSTPSVTHGTFAEENMKEVVQEFAASFPDIAAILVLSFRVDFKGNPHIIELHADLTGDLILDILLPASCEEFDPWTLILEAVTDRVVHFSGAGFLPICLYYCSEKFSSIQGYDLIQKSTIKTNLETFSDIMIAANQDIDHPPKHLQWLLKINEDFKVFV